MFEPSVEQLKQQILVYTYRMQTSKYPFLKNKHEATARRLQRELDALMKAKKQ